MACTGSLSYSNSIKFIEVGTGRGRGECSYDPKRIARIKALTTIVSPDGTRVLASLAVDGIRLWDFETKDQLAWLQLTAEAESFAALPDGRLAVGDKLGRIHWLRVEW